MNPTDFITFLKTETEENVLKMLDELEDPSILLQTKVEGFTPLFHAAMLGNVSICRKLLQLGANLNHEIDGYRPIHFALVNKRTSLVKFFEKCGDVVNPSEMAKEMPHFSKNVSFSKKQVTNTAFSQNETWFDAVKSGHLDKIKQIFQEGSQDINEIDQNGQTALALAVRLGHHAMAVWMAKNGGSYGPRSCETPKRRVSKGKKKGVKKLKRNNSVMSLNRSRDFGKRKMKVEKTLKMSSEKCEVTDSVVRLPVFSFEKSHKKKKILSPEKMTLFKSPENLSTRNIQIMVNDHVEEFMSENFHQWLSSRKSCVV